MLSSDAAPDVSQSGPIRYPYAGLIYHALHRPGLLGPILTAIGYFSAAKIGGGLGLSICKTIIASHGGKLWAENLPVGAALHFTLPLVSERMCPPPRAEDG